MRHLRAAVAAYELAQAASKLHRAVRGHPESPHSLWGLLTVEDPWHIPLLLYRVPLIPVRIWLRVGDAVLFRLWWHSRPVIYALADGIEEDKVMREWAADDRRAALNAHLDHMADVTERP